jgi:hypothetical protein
LLLAAAAVAWGMQRTGGAGSVKPVWKPHGLMSAVFSFSAYHFVIALRHWHFHFVWIAVRSTLVAGASDVRDALS